MSIQALPNRNLLQYDVLPDGARLYTHKAGHIDTAPLTLTDLLGGINAFETKEDYKDIERELRLVGISFNGSMVCGSIVGRDGIEQTMPMTKTAFQQLLSFVPGINYRDVNHHWTTDERGMALTTAMFSHLALQQYDRDIFIRTAVRSDVGRCIRSVHGSGSGNSYSPFSNSQMLEGLIDNAPEFSKSLVVGATLTDDLMRIRLAAPKRYDDGSFGLLNPSEIELNKRIGTIDMRNSNTGKSSIVFGNGSWRLVCTNGMTMYDVKHRKQRRHSGDMDRLNTFYQGAIESILTEQYGMLKQYEQSLDVFVTDIVGWVKQTLNKARDTSAYQISDGFIDAVATEGLNHATTPQDNTLSQAVEAVSLIAQRSASLEHEILMEQLATWTLSQGLNQSIDNRILVEA